MPIPEPKEGENEDKFISRCVSKMAELHPEKDNKERLAICYSQYEDANEDYTMPEPIAEFLPENWREELENEDKEDAGKDEV